jgi:hypothetical protein
VNSVAVPVQLGSEIGELLPTLELGAIVERHDNELRRAIDAGSRRRTSAKRNERRHCGDESSGGQFSPPTERDSDSLVSLSDHESELIAGQRINRRAEQKSRRCDRKSTVSHRRSVAASGRRWLTMMPQSHTTFEAPTLRADASEQRRRVRERGDAEAPSGDAGRT